MLHQYYVISSSPNLSNEYKHSLYFFKEKAEVQRERRSDSPKAAQLEWQNQDLPDSEYLNTMASRKI